MSKSEDAVNFTKNITTQPLTNVGRNNAAQNLYNFVDLEPEDESAIERLVAENIDSENIDQDEGFDDDLRKLKDITKSIKGIAKAGVYLMGKQIHEAREILKKHNKTGDSFGQWLQIAFKGSKSTAYNALAYFGFCESLPTNELKKRFKAIPQKAAYLLASRDGDIENKIKVLENSQPKNASEIMDLVGELLPLPDKDRRKSKINQADIIKDAHDGLKKLFKIKEYLSPINRHDLRSIVKLIEDILSESLKAVDDPKQMDIDEII